MQETIQQIINEYDVPKWEYPECKPVKQIQI